MLFIECFLLKLRPWLFFWIPMTLLLPIDRCYTWIPTELLQTKNPCYPYRTSINIANWMPKTMSLPKISPDKRCCVPNCSKTRLDDIILHNFPNPEKEPERFRTWLYAISGLDGDILALDKQIIFKYRKVCHDHFHPREYTAGKRLCANAVPTLHLPGFQILKKKSQELKQHPVQDVAHIQAESSSAQEVSVNRRPMQDITNTKASQVEIQEEIQPIINRPCSSEGDKKTRKPLSKKYMSEVSVLTQKIKRLQMQNSNYAARLKKALKLSENENFQRIMKNSSTAACIFMTMQFRERNKGMFGRRYTKEEKVLALAFYKMGPRAYRFWRNAFILPSPVTLSRMITKANLHPGINSNIFEHLKKRAKKMTDAEKLCILLFDEMALSPHFDYNKRKDRVTGFVNNGINIKKNIANHALVFMVHGVKKSYKQPLAYSFCSGSTPKEDLKVQIKIIIKKLHEVGMTVVATVCDQGASNVGAIRDLIAETRSSYLRKGEEFYRNTFEIDNHEIIPCFDAPHLLKGIRNNMLKKNITCEINKKKIIAKWTHIRNLYEENPAFNGIRLLPKLTELHVIPDKIPKMKVKYATQIFSRSVSSTMGYLAEKKILEEDAKQTAIFIQFMDDVFDSANGSYGNMKKKMDKFLLTPVTKYSKHSEEWAKFIKVFRTMKLVDQHIVKTVPSIQNWIFTLENYIYFKDKLINHHNLKSFWMRNLNQDPLENFFGSIRSHGARNVNPTCSGFEIAFAAVLVNKISSHSRGSNCEEDTCQNMLLKSLKNIFFSSKNILNNVDTEIDFNYVMSDHIFVGLDNKSKNPIVMASLEYVTGYVLRKARGNILKNCKYCINNLYCKEKDSEAVQRKERIANKKCLTYPSKELVKVFSDLQDVITYIIRNYSHVCNIKNYIKTILSIVMNYENIKCQVHKKELINYIENLSCDLFLFNWCKDTNKILRGHRKDVHPDDVIQKLCFDYYNKIKK